jgi:hypothetical protein
VVLDLGNADGSLTDMFGNLEQKKTLTHLGPGPFGSGGPIWVRAHLAPLGLGPFGPAGPGPLGPGPLDPFGPIEPKWAQAH